MNKLIIIAILGVFIVGTLTVSFISNNFVDANSTKKIHFTKTLTSSQDPGKGHTNHQLALILSPNDGTLYDGSMTFTASELVDVVVLHEITNNDVKGQPTWTIDGNTIYAISLIDLNAKSGSFEFTGAALALHSPNSKEFTSTVSVDGWIRGQPTEVIMQKIEVQKNPPLSLSRANIDVSIPMHEGFYNGNSVFYIITDSSQKEYAEIITKRQSWKVEVAPAIKKISDNTLQTIFIFKNGVNGDGLFGRQKEVFSSTPSQEQKYSALNYVVEVTWKKGQNATILESYEDVINAEKNGRVEFNKTGIVINTPQIIWPDGQMLIKNDREVANNFTFDGGQITEINKDEMTVTFVAHRGWGPDGKTIYYIIADATPFGPAKIMGIPFSPISENLLTNSSKSDLFQFKNGIKSSGSLGFQAEIIAVMPGNENYSPIWRVYNIEWNNPENATILETMSDITSSKIKDLIIVSLARTMNNQYVINAPIIDPFQ
ncbi:MAG: hypothetical protein ACE5R7_00295 [Nitrosarchaeum sp.]